MVALSNRVGVFQNLCPQFQSASVVQIQDVDRRAADRGNAYDAHTLEGKVLGPLVEPGMEKTGNLTCLRVNSGQVRSLVKIAAVARERQIVGVLGPGVLPRDDVLDVMRQLAMHLAQAAVFASLFGPAADQVPRGPTHLLLDCRVKLLPSLELEDRNEVRRIDQRFIFRAFDIG